LEGEVRSAAGVLIVFTVLTGFVHRHLVANIDRAIYIPPTAIAADGPPLAGFARGDQLLHIWALANNIRHLRHDPGAVFEANGFFPHARSLFFSDHLFGEALFVLPFTLVTTNPVALHNIALLLSFVISGSGLALLVRMLTGSTPAGIVAGVAWTFGPPRSFEIYQLQLLTTQWIPVVLLFLHRAVRTRRFVPALGAAAFLGLQLLSGIYVGTYFVLCLVPFAAIELASTRHLRLAWAAAWRLGLAVALAAVAVMPWFLEYLHVQATFGEYGGLLENVAYSLSLQHYLLPNWVLGAGRFPGPLVLTTALLAVVGALWPVAEAGRERWSYLLTTMWAALLSLGPYVRYGAGPETSADPGFLFRGPYAVLYELVPGLDALRVPARMSLVVGFFLAVLVGFGVARILRVLAPVVTGTARRSLLVGALVALIAVESAPRAPGVELLPVGDEVPQVYRWLQGQGGDDAIVELPMGVLRDPTYLYYSTIHWRPLVNGYGAYLPALYQYLHTRLYWFPDPGAIDALREIGVRSVITHGLDAVVPEDRRDLALVASFGADRVYDVRRDVEASAPAVDPGERGERELAPEGWSANAGVNAADALRAIDGDPATAWSNVGDLTRALLGGRGGGLAWLRRLGDWPSYRSAYLLEGRSEIFTLDLGATVTPRRVEMLLRAHQTHVFAPFALAVSSDGSRWQRIRCPWRPAAALRDYAAHQAGTWIEVRCDFPATRYLRVEQDPADFRIYWELAEVRIFAQGG
jgi:hypothetical protein